MYQILLIGDPHFKTSNALETTQLHKSSLQYLKSNPSIDFVVVLGDILHCHEKINTQPFCRAVNFLTDLANERETFALIGNHDRINNNVFLTQEHPFTGLKEYKNLHIVDTTLYFSHSSSQGEDNLFAFVPYVPNGRFKEALEINKKNESDKNEYEKCIGIFAHQEFMGSKQGAYVSEDGDEWEENLPPVFSGHMHEYQRLQKNIFYPGIPFQHGFGDSDDKAIYLLTLRTPASRGEERWETQKIELEITPKKLFNMKLEEFQTFVPPENSVIKINFMCQDTSMKKIISTKQFREKIKKHKIEYKLKVEKTKSIIKNHSSFLENLVRRISQSDKEIQESFKEIMKQI
tara:strand:+ start:97 stop:1137 length:1041 start_codon:yes stop_codon:yes gene_type:complete